MEATSGERRSVAPLKRCGNPRCGRVRPRGDFYDRVDSKDGKQGYCKDCARKATRTHYHATGKTRISVPVSEVERVALEARAKDSGLSIGSLCAIVISMWLAGDLVDKPEDPQEGQEAEVLEELRTLVNG